MARGEIHWRHSAGAALLALHLAAAANAGALESLTGCDPVGGSHPLCGFQNPDDLALLPDGSSVLVSEYGAMGARPGRIVSAGARER